MTCREILQIYGADIFTYAAKHNVNPALIIMTIATESEFAREDRFTGPRTFRWEAHVENTDVAVPFFGSYSAGPMQSLATTVRYMLREHAGKFSLNAYDDTVAPAIAAKPNPPPAAHPLYEAPASIEIGIAEIRMRWAQSKDDPILVAAVSAAGATGALLGFLFGIPRLLQRPATSQPQTTTEPQPAGTPLPNQRQMARERFFSSNTSFEEISDWLTKIIIGLGLVQFQTILEYLRIASLFTASYITYSPVPEVLPASLTARLR